MYDTSALRKTSSVTAGTIPWRDEKVKGHNVG